MIKMQYIGFLDGKTVTFTVGDEVAQRIEKTEKSDIIEPVFVFNAFIENDNVFQRMVAVPGNREYSRV